MALLRGRPVHTSRPDHEPPSEFSTTTTPARQRLSGGSGPLTARGGGEFVRPALSGWGARPRSLVDIARGGVDHLRMMIGEAGNAPRDRV